MNGKNRMMDMGGFMGGGGNQWWIWAILITLVVGFAVVVWMLSRIKSGQQQAITEPSPLQQLDRRFARGEMDPEDYEARRRLISQNT